MSTFKKVKKLLKNPKLFFKDAIEKRKKHKGFAQYTIISAVYNVEKYLDDYFNSIINQRLDFKKNIFMILVDDGSTDDSANIIKKYQKKYPKNIVYLYKENGGQASARNLGLKYMQENNYKTPWVTFTDPDDFLDRNYFYEVDKFLSTHQDDDICMIATNVILYNDKTQDIQQHACSFKFNNKSTLKSINSLKNEMQSSTPAIFVFKRISQAKIFFNEDKKLATNFEDGLFCYEYMLKNYNSNIVFLKESIYYYRKQILSSTTSKALKEKEFYLGVCQFFPELYLKFKHVFKHTLYIENIILYFFFWQIKPIINSPEKISILNENEKQQYLKLLDQNFSYIDNDTIMNFSLAGCWFFHKVGILNCFKNEKPPFQIAYIEDYDPYKEQILITYYTGDDKDIESIRIDNEAIYADYEKIVKYDFLDRVFCYQKRLWINIPKYAKDKLEIFINDKQIMVGKYGEYSLDVKNIRKELQKRLPKSDIWLFADRDYEADDNAEHLYRYIMKNHPEQEIVFALRKESSDWERLEKEGFNLIEFGSFEFERIIEKIEFFISSHHPAAFNICLKQYQQFIFLGHGTDAVDLSRWFNTLNIRLRISSLIPEYYSLFDDYNRYTLTDKEVAITGQPRHDSLYQNNKTGNKNILIMPTWRTYLVYSDQNAFDRKIIEDTFFSSNYYHYWNSLLNNKALKELVYKYGYSITFTPHFNMRSMLERCTFPNYIKIVYRREGKSFQENFQNADLMITDYTSAAFEMAYLGKPVIYYQFDREEFFKNHSYQQGWFDYKKDGFGPVVENEENLLKELEVYLQKDCLTFSNNELFAFAKGGNCNRVYNAIKFIKEKDDKNRLFLYKQQYLLNKIKRIEQYQTYDKVFKMWAYILNNFGCANINETDVYNTMVYAEENNYIDMIQKFLHNNNFAFCSTVLKKQYVKILLKSNNIALLINFLEKIYTNKNNYEVFLFIKMKLYYLLKDFKNYNIILQILVDKYNKDVIEMKFECFLLSSDIYKDVLIYDIAQIIE
ncbi:CDP-glycerol:glycerophosphate glycerophosphotransferase [Campylobacter lari]|uniref:CDP-glycerol:glycerophosphate glycerophosphotransferase n=1 Tax=Campylobacter lari TaxID=201 RepID=UPI00397BD3B3